MLQKIKTYFTITLVVVLLAGLGVTSYLYFGNYSEGTRSGRLMKVSRKGVLIKTYEGQLDVGGISTAGKSGLLTSTWEFSIDRGNKELIRQLELASGRMVRLHYEEKFYHFFWRGDTRYFVTSVEPL